MPKLFVVRHAEPAVHGVLLGRTDPPLGERGLQQARRLWTRMAVATVYSSPLSRCRQTASFAPAPVVVLPELIEISLGEWDGRRWSEIEEANEAMAHAKLDDWLGVTPPGGEPWPDFAARVRSALAVIRAGPLPAAVVGHLAVNAVIAAELSHVDPTTFNQRYAEVLEFEISSRQSEP